MRDELSRKIMKEFVEFKSKTYSYLTSDSDESKKEFVQKNVLQKENLNLKITRTV